MMILSLLPWAPCVPLIQSRSRKTTSPAAVDCATPSAVWSYHHRIARGVE